MNANGQVTGQGEAASGSMGLGLGARRVPGEVTMGRLTMGGLTMGGLTMGRATMRRRALAVLSLPVVLLGLSASVRALPTGPSLLAGALVPTVEDSGSSAEGVREERGRALLAEAAAARQTAYRLEGDEREAGLLAAAGRFGVLADDETMSVGVRAEAAFRGGEILRARKLSEQAGVRFVQARDLGASAAATDPAFTETRRFGARAQLELAHACRRGGDADAALAAYAAVKAVFPSQARQLGQAAVWRARLFMELGQSDAAQGEASVLSDLAAMDAMEAVRTAEGVATELAEVGELQRAEAVVAALEHHLRGRLQEADGKLAVALSAVRVTVLSYGS